MQLDVKNASDIKQFLKSCSGEPGVYQMLSEKQEVLYIGKARNIAKRLSSYFNKNKQTTKIASLISQVADIRTTVTNTEAEALILECNLIKKYKPKYNVLLRDDKSYPYISLSNHCFPRISLHRAKDSAQYNKNKNLSCYGPYTNVYAAKETIKLLEQVFLLRSCTDSYFNNRTRPCLLYQINRCSAPCVKYINKDKYHDSIRYAKLFLESKDQELITRLAGNMEEYSSKQEYESAALLRDKIKQLQDVFAKQYVGSQKALVATDVIAFITDNQHSNLALVIMQYRDGNLIGSKEYSSKLKLDYVPKNIIENNDENDNSGHCKYNQNSQETEELEELLVSVVTQYYIYNKNPIKEIVINYNLSSHSKKIIVEIMGSNLKINGKNNNSVKEKWLSLAIKNANEILVNKLGVNTKVEQQFILLQQELKNEINIDTIECIDVSHTFGDQIVASCVVFSRTKGPEKSLYRKYNINNKKIDDIAAIKEVVNRRYKKAFVSKKNNQDVLSNILPDLILIDGGKGQINAVKKIFEQNNIILQNCNVILLGITKGEGRRSSNDRLLDSVSMSELAIEKHSGAMHLLQQIRDEAHRFAIIGHRARRDKNHLHSVLEDISGVGAKRKKALLTHLGGFQGLLKASVEQIEKVPGIGCAKAKQIYEYIHRLDFNS